MKHILTASLFALSASVFAGSASHTGRMKARVVRKTGASSATSLPPARPKFQSPIDIRNAYNATLPPLEMNFHTAAESCGITSHTLQVTASDEDEFRLDDQIFTCASYHFHTPSENRINGPSFPLEAHFVHASKGRRRSACHYVLRSAQAQRTQPAAGAASREKDHEISVLTHLDLRPLFR